MSHMSRGRKKGGSELFWELVREGPKPVSIHSGGINPDLRLGYDIRGFDVASSTQHGGVPDTEKVIYLNDYHSPEEVVEAWIDLNREILEKQGPIGRRKFSSNCPPKFKEALLGTERSWVQSLERTNSGGGGTSPGVCQFCGEEYDVNFPHHLRSCEEV